MSFFSLPLPVVNTGRNQGEKSAVARRQVVVAMVNLSGTAGPISIKCRQAGSEPEKLMPAQTGRRTDRKTLTDRKGKKGC